MSAPHEFVAMLVDAGVLATVLPTLLAAYRVVDFSDDTWQQFRLAQATFAIMVWVRTLFIMVGWGLGLLQRECPLEHKDWLTKAGHVRCHGAQRACEGPFRSEGWCGCTRSPSWSVLDDVGDAARARG